MFRRLLSSSIASMIKGEFSTVYKIEMPDDLITEIINTKINELDIGLNYSIEDFMRISSSDESINDVQNVFEIITSGVKEDMNISEVDMEEDVMDLRLDEKPSALYVKPEENIYESNLACEEIATYTVENNNILIGTDVYSGSSLNWEFKDSRLQNRHLLITGSSGSGKTYAIQTLMYEVLKNQIPIIIFDYTEGFRPNQMSSIFRNKMSNKIVEHIVRLDKIGINPFERYEVDFGDGLKIPEETYQIATRIAESFKNVYAFKEQQFSALYEAIKNGIDTYGEKFNFKLLNNELESSENKSAISVKTKILPLMDADVFRSENKLNWKDIHDDSKVHIIQMMHYSREIQTIITELVLWDFWNYIKTCGSADKPIVIVLDEAQNISHSEKSPSGYILTEGRKFGVSGWYATQFLKNSVDNDEIERLQQAAQKLFFRPTESGVSEVASYISTDKDQQLMWRNKLLNLQKGECVSIGSHLDMTKLIRYTPKVIKITSFEERIDR